MTETFQDYFIEVGLDIDRDVKTFRYTDELQDKAKEKKANRDMIINLITGAPLAGTAVTGVGSLWAGAITSGVSKWMANPAFAQFAGVPSRASKGVQSAAGKLKLPGKGPVATEEVWITAAPVLPGSTCEQDTQGETKGRICFEERSGIVYYIQVASVHKDKKIRLPPGIDVLLSEEGFNGLHLTDFVRGPLFSIEVWRPTFKGEEDPDIETLFHQSTEQPALMLKRHLKGRKFDVLDPMPWNSEREVRRDFSNMVTPGDHIRLLDHYGKVLGAINIAVCYSWSGEAITDVNSSHNTNAPCLCDPPARSYGRPWSNPKMAYTKQFLRDSKLYENNKFGKMCRKHNKCEKNGKWEDQLNLPKGHEVAEEMKDAWRSCKHPRGHGDHDPGGSLTEELPMPVKTREPVSIPVLFPGAQTTPSVTTDYYRNANGSIKTSVRTIASSIVTAWMPNPKLQPHLETQEWHNEETTFLVATMVTPTPQPSM
ncbi:hypothetical protein HBI56_170130 [Parastagonospora nodorum]|uniref:Uncharacterized protein n=1 Tax=Phaeosphaeria nodorum (strain SN15 / ATCC MYA-4574 / FGSC 10173) TaxID=321614 RepID=A0A7U2I3F8_PHANO|nr:hypothetical protein HBH56_048620 [Parastagonospora nodorum]QRD01926.1 hypothetical protein JI435_048990 [Parastagonospora nodorum SN15]KAH3935549.1 hypothetical protein HBH54_034400 [Parastagonospora nodorum]KAH3964174.1 hypothetical protein HBH51_160250 [Parastagonospora nodorum]KAH3988949.1 hypothetical protein HBH52_023590 [Parastagonospora nodorum]